MPNEQVNGALRLSGMHTSVGDLLRREQVERAQSDLARSFPAQQRRAVQHTDGQFPSLPI